MNAKEKKRRFAARALAKAVNKPMIPVWCANGLCEGEVFQTKPGTKELRVIIPMNPAYKIAVYGITDKITSNGEYAAIFLHGVPR